MLEVNDLIPTNIQLKNEKDELVSLKDYLDSPLIIFFYPKDETPGCTKEACSFRDNYKEIIAKGYNVIGISKDSVTSHQKFKDKHHLQFPLLSDESLELLQAFGVWVERRMYGKTMMGIQRSTFAVDQSGVIQYVWPKVKPADHGQAVLDWISGN